MPTMTGIERIARILRRQPVDHSIPNTVHYDTYRYFVEKGLALGTY